jgi:hypothetical protein
MRASITPLGTMTLRTDNFAAIAALGNLSSENNRGSEFQMTGVKKMSRILAAYSIVGPYHMTTYLRLNVALVIRIAHQFLQKFREVIATFFTVIEHVPFRVRLQHILRSFYHIVY